MSEPATALFLFDTTHHALWAEEVAAELGLGAQIVPAPSDARANCDLALEALSEDRQRLENELRSRGIEFRLRSGSGD